ncbi:hypothetical protein EJ02DRAFT_364543 [Clathrospora elynae]|uniref:F-box domain-containing protein n=1 Tax=Clathrospora elynae TaxID=706981 RepID=A0A6A5T721_9PLEO|nr:hypothetical protein EJ02DRAFT_364543 [Clathrospora elynae]
MTLSTLTPELKLEIAEYLDPESSLSFALTCGTHLELCRSILRKHRQLFSQWQVIDTANCGTLLWKTLKEVLDDPRKGWYVRELNLPMTRQYQWDTGHLPISDGPSDEEKDMFKEAARKLENLYPTIEKRSNPDGTSQPYNKVVTNLEIRINEGFDDAIVAILLHYLPFLTSIRITDIETSCLELMMESIAHGYKEPGKASLLPLQHLTTAAVAHWASEGPSHPEWACYFLAIPSLRIFAAEAMGSGFHDCLLKEAPSCSNVEELFFKRCSFDVKALEEILAETKELKKFTYTGGGATVSEHNFYDPRRVVEALGRQVGNSLEELVLELHDDDVEWNEETDLRHVTLRNFKKLELLNCDLQIVRPTADEVSEDEEPLQHGYYRKEDCANIKSEFDVRTLFPESLQELYMHDAFEDDEGIYGEWDHMNEVFSSPSTFTPNLTLEKTYIEKRRNGVTEAVIGGAEKPVSIYRHPLTRLFYGHGIA